MSCRDHLIEQHWSRPEEVASCARNCWECLWLLFITRAAVMVGTARKMRRNETPGGQIAPKLTDNDGLPAQLCRDSIWNTHATRPSKAHYIGMGCTIIVEVFRFRVGLFEAHGQCVRAQARTYLAPRSSRAEQAPADWVVGRALAARPPRYNRGFHLWKRPRPSLPVIKTPLWTSSARSSALTSGRGSTPAGSRRDFPLSRTAICTSATPSRSV